MKNKTELLTLLGVVLGIGLGILLPEYAAYCKFLGSIFLTLLKVLILPIIVLSLFLAISQISSFEFIKKLGTKTILYYLTTTGLAVITSISLANVFIFDEVNEMGATAESPTKHIDMVAQIFSSNIFKSLSEGQILHIVVFIILFTLAFITFPKEKKQPIIDVANTLYDVILKLITWVLKIAPIGIFALIWNATASFDHNTFKKLEYFFIATALATLIHCFVNLAIVGRVFGKFNIFRYFLKVKEAVIIALTTASSSASLPVSIKVSQEAGVEKKVAQFVLPLGATLNMDGSALYQSLLIMLFANIAGIDLDLSQQFLLFILIALSSAGTAGVPSGGIVMVTLVLNLFKIPNVEGCIAIYMAVDRFWDYPITAVNVWSDLIGAKTVNHYFKSEKT